MSGNANSLFGDLGEVRLRRLDHALDIPAGGIIDEWIMTIPPGIAGVKNVRLNKVGRNITVGVAGSVVGECDGRTIKMQRFFLIEDFGGNRAGGRWREGEVPTFHACSCGKMF